MSATSILKAILAKEDELNRQKKQIAVMFVDMSGSTFYKQQKGIEAGLKHVVLHNLTVTKVVTELGKKFRKEGQIDECDVCKYVGDEVMVYVAGRKAAETMIRMARAIQSKFTKMNNSINDPLDKFNSRIGIDFGDVYFYEYLPRILDPQGSIVDCAARLVALAKPNQILISEAVRKACKSNVGKFGKSAERELKGIGKIHVYEAIMGKELGIASSETNQRLPRLLRLHLVERIYRLDSKGNAKVVWNLLVENISDKTLSRISFPVMCDVYDNTETNTKYIKIEKVKIGKQQPRHRDEYYRPIGILMPKSGPRRETGSFVIPFSEIGGLKKSTPTQLQISYRIGQAFRNMDQEDGEFTNVDIHHPTDKLRVIVNAPRSREIELKFGGAHPNGFEVIDSNADVIDPKAMAETPEPKSVSKTRVEWVIPQPYTTYKYRLYFSVK